MTEERPEKTTLEQMILDQAQAYEYLLKKYAGYEKDRQSLKFRYKNRENDEALKRLYLNYNLSHFQNNRTEPDCFCELLEWSYNSLNFRGQRAFCGAETADDILTFSRKNKCRMNCRQHAIVLTDALLALGYCARTVCCMPIDLVSADSHTMTAVFSKTLGKWIALDPANCCWFGTEDEEYLSPDEVRGALISGKKLEIHYQNRFFSLYRSNFPDRDWMMTYLKKNMFRFYCFSGAEVYYHLVPMGFLPCQTEIAHGLSGEITTIVTTTDAAQFWGEPDAEGRLPD